MAYILVADDDPLLGELVRLRLEAEGHEIRIVPDGGVVLQAVREHRPDLIILDSMMPVVSGPLVLKELKADPTAASIPVMMLTSRHGQGDVLGAFEAGADEYMTKPFMPAELALRVNHLLFRVGHAA